ncbi:MAG: hypothetical protein COZ12_07165 [Deltaproteobacteria bacterium CG_4_10_14_3_um_filter_60_8]|nr:MAG: hypothetical protein AUK28_10215 [Desulfobacterales bacterium CG2_30_60_27]PIY20982.1 MAG: hypothetical protein COZ12_07165 [Deltaproteobacteria bacterium CG_4_10_14_3_um_filter_60_8]
MALLIFTDLDGSLLNHADYSFEAARPVLARIGARAIPLVFVTSETRGEVEIIQQEMGIAEPFVVENGGGIYFPAGYQGFAIEAGRALAGYTVVEFATSSITSGKCWRGLSIPWCIRPSISNSARVTMPGSRKNYTVG